MLLDKTKIYMTKVADQYQEQQQYPPQPYPQQYVPQQQAPQPQGPTLSRGQAVAAGATGLGMVGAAGYVGHAANATMNNAAKKMKGIQMFSTAGNLAAGAGNMYGKYKKGEALLSWMAHPFQGAKNLYNAGKAGAGVAMSQGKGATGGFWRGVGGRIADSIKSRAGRYMEGAAIQGVSNTANGLFQNVVITPLMEKQVARHGSAKMRLIGSGIAGLAGVGLAAYGASQAAQAKKRDNLVRRPPNQGGMA